jgi:hypothetical protein
VEERKEVFIVAGGPSLRGFDFNLLRNRETITVNKSVLVVPNPKYFITVDFTFLRKLKNLNLQTRNNLTKVFIACMHFPYMIEDDGRILDTRNGIIYDLRDFDVIIKSYVVAGIGYSFNEFRNGLNSGFCALQLAVLLGYKKIYLMGVDLMVLRSATTHTHYHEGYLQSPSKFVKNLEEYHQHFVTALTWLKRDTDIEVISLSRISKLNNMIEFKEFSGVLI